MVVPLGCEMGRSGVSVAGAGKGVMVGVGTTVGRVVGVAIMVAGVANGVGVGEERRLSVRQPESNQRLLPVPIALKN